MDYHKNLLDLFQRSSELLSKKLIVITAITTISIAVPLNHTPLKNSWASGDEIAEDAIDDEVKCMADMIYFEARGEPIAGQYAVGWVTLNRTTHRNYPSSICGVISQPYQYSWYKKKRNIHDVTTYRKIIQVSQSVIQYYNHGVIPDGLHKIKHALFFDSLRPSKNAVKIGRHNFYNRK